jgi:hypothetical protein
MIVVRKFVYPLKKIADSVQEKLCRRCRPIIGLISEIAEPLLLLLLRRQLSAHIGLRSELVPLMLQFIMASIPDHDSNVQGRQSPWRGCSAGF